MRMLHRFRTLWRNLLTRERVEADLDEEVRSYRDMLEDEKLRSGAEPRAAHRDASVVTGSIESIKEQSVIFAWA